MTRAELWNKQNNVEDNYNLIKNLFQIFGFKEHINFFKDYDNAIRFKRWRNGYEQVYRIVVNEKIHCLEIYIRSVKNNKLMKKNFHLYKNRERKPLRFNSFVPWFDCIKWLRKAR